MNKQTVACLISVGVWMALLVLYGFVVTSIGLVPPWYITIVVAIVVDIPIVAGFVVYCRRHCL